MCSQSVVWKWGIYVLGLHNVLRQSLVYRIGSLFPLGGTRCVGDLGGLGRFMCLRFSVYLCVRLLGFRASLEGCTGVSVWYRWYWNYLVIWSFILFSTSVGTVCQTDLRSD